jgi:hypothetical protein
MKKNLKVLSIALVVVCGLATALSIRPNLTHSTDDVVASTPIDELVTQSCQSVENRTHIIKSLDRHYRSNLKVANFESHLFLIPSIQIMSKSLFESIRSKSENASGELLKIVAYERAVRTTCEAQLKDDSSDWAKELVSLSAPHEKRTYEFLSRRS